LKKRDTYCNIVRCDTISIGEYERAGGFFAEAMSESRGDEAKEMRAYVVRQRTVKQNTGLTQFVFGKKKGKNADNGEGERE